MKLIFKDIRKDIILLKVEYDITFLNKKVYSYIKEYHSITSLSDGSRLWECGDKLVSMDKSRVLDNILYSEL